MSASVAEGAQSHTVEVDGPLHYRDMGGPADGPLLVGVHGLGGSHLNWSAVAPRLTGQARVMALDLVGHGWTPVAGRTADIAGHRRLLSGFLRSLGGRPVILAGNSMGGLVAALQAAEEPESVAGLILIDPALPTARLGLAHPRVLVNFLVCAVPGLGESYLTQRRLRTTAEQSVQRVLGICCADASRVPAEVVEAHVELTAGIDRARADAAYLRSARSLSMMMVRPTVTLRRLAGLSQPVLLLHGERDLLVPQSAARRMSESHPEWQFEVAPDTGHVPMLEAPDWTAGAIVAWLGGAGQGAVARATAAGPVS
jgi:pimeloyl-ACP methyl ester carboxylesterase